MSDILTLSVNPALDSAAEVETVKPDIKLYCQNATLEAGGGGVNVSRALLLLGGDSTAFVALGGATGGMLLDMLKQDGVRVARFDAPGLTRQNTAILETSTRRQFRFGQAGPCWSAKDVARAIRQIDGLIGRGTMVVGSGSLPPGVAPAFYAGINRMAHARGGQMVLDTSGEAMTSALDNTVLPFHVVRMDRHESQVLSGRALERDRDAVHFAHSLILRDKAEIVVLARGAKGSLIVSGDEAFICAPPVVEVRSKVGAGDSFVAAMTLGLSRGWTLRKSAQYGTAAAAAAVTTPGSALCPRATLEALLPEVVTREAHGDSG